MNHFVRSAFLALALNALPGSASAQQAAPTAPDTALVAALASFHQLWGRALEIGKSRSGTSESEIAGDVMQVAIDMHSRVKTAIDFEMILNVVSDSASRVAAGRVVFTRLYEMARESEKDIPRLDYLSGATGVPGTALLAGELRTELRRTVILFRMLSIRWR